MPSSQNEYLVSIASQRQTNSIKELKQKLTDSYKQYERQADLIKEQKSKLDDYSNQLKKQESQLHLEKQKFAQLMSENRQLTDHIELLY